MKNLQKTLGVELNEFGFINSKEYHPNQTNREGIYAAGSSLVRWTFQNLLPRAALPLVSMLCFMKKEARKSAVKEYPPEINVIGEKPRIGVFVCYCGLNIGGYLDVEEVAKYISVPNVVYAETNLLYLLFGYSD